MGEKVLVATSQDGLSFEYQGVALEGGAIPNSHYENGKFYLYTGGIEISESSDGLNYKKTGQRFEAENTRTNDPSLVKVDNGNYFMFYKTSINNNPQDTPFQNNDLFDNMVDCSVFEEQDCLESTFCQPNYGSSTCQGNICTDDLIFINCNNKK